MLEPKYANRFSVLVNHAQEAILTFNNDVPILNEKFELVQIETIEISKIVMTEYNFKELYKTIGNIIEQVDNQQDTQQ